MDDPAIQALLIPLREGAVAGADALFLNARAPAGAWPCAPPACVQTFRPWSDALHRHGDAAATEPESAPRVALAMLLPPRQREWSRALLAQAVEALVPGGVLLLAAANDEGAKSHEADLARIAQAQPRVLSKHKCRVAWARVEAADADLVAAWTRAGAPRLRDDGLWTQAGVFSADAVDPASALLMAHLPADLAGDVADFGAGIGVLSRHVVRHCRQVRRVDLYEADHRALQLARRNLDDADADTRFHWHDIATGVRERFDAVVMNPPFHLTGKRGVPELGQRFIEVAADALQPRGRLWLVANAHLPYEEMLSRRFARVDAVAKRVGFKVLHAAEPRR